MTLSEASEYIAGIPRFAKKTKPENTKELMRRLGNPEDSFRVIHIAGTNGKGSVSAFLESILRTEGFRTGLFTSPHLVSVRERFQIQREEVPEGTFLRAFRKVLDVTGKMIQEGYEHPAYFEFLFAMGMLIFQEEKIDVLVMETGLGGRLDATNCVRHPNLTVITSISFDHMEYLGSTLIEIAGEKAGIIKQGVPVVLDCFPREEFDVNEAVSVVRRKAAEMNAPLHEVTRSMAEGVFFSERGLSFSINNSWYHHQKVSIPFFADYQVENCTVAMTAAAIFGCIAGHFSLQSVLSGVSDTHWMGRMEAVMPGVILDGAHNADGIVQFLHTAERIHKIRHLGLLFAAVCDKDYRKMVKEICQDGLFDFVITTEISGPRMLPADRLKEVFEQNADVPVVAVKQIPEAFRMACRMRGDRVLFCAGSLYLVGEIRKELR